MNLNYITKRGHIFKSRSIRKTFRPFKLRLGTSGLFSLKQQRFEFVYLRTLKKIIKRRYLKKRMRFRPCKFWLFLVPNCVLSCKSVNSRMGAGVGSMVRLAIRLKMHISFVEFKNYSPRFLRRISSYTRYKLPLNFIS